MSGPTVVVVTANPATVLIAAAAIAAQAIMAGHLAAADQRSENAHARAGRQQALDTAAAAGHSALTGRAAAAEARFERLVALAERLDLSASVNSAKPARCQAGESEDECAALAAYVRALTALADDIETVLLARAAAAGIENPLPDGIAAAATAVPSTTPATRLLARVAHLGPPPEDIAALAREIENTPPGDRLELLLSEMRRRIQLLLDADEQSRVQIATAVVVDKTLQDLGYQVEEIAETLFVEGGVTHFRRAGWGDYMVRLRVDAKAGTANFNVIRAVDGAAHEASLLDHIAEDRWCAEFPALLAALAERGVHLSVTRRLEAGELPVQCVDRGKLPHFADEETTRQASRPLTRSLG